MYFIPVFALETWQFRTVFAAVKHTISTRQQILDKSFPSNQREEKGKIFLKFHANKIMHKNTLTSLFLRFCCDIRRLIIKILFILCAESVSFRGAKFLLIIYANEASCNPISIKGQNQRMRKVSTFLRRRWECYLVTIEVGGSHVRDVQVRGRTYNTYGGIIAMRPHATSRILCRMHRNPNRASLSMRCKIS